MSPDGNETRTLPERLLDLRHEACRRTESNCESCDTLEDAAEEIQRHESQRPMNLYRINPNLAIDAERIISATIRDAESAVIDDAYTVEIDYVQIDGLYHVVSYSRPVGPIGDEDNQLEQEWRNIVSYEQAEEWLEQILIDLDGVR